MKLKLSSPRKGHHSDMVNGIGWIGNESIISAADDHAFILSNTISNESTQIMKMQTNFFPTCLHVFPRTPQKTSQTDVFAVSTSNGKISILSTSGKVEKVVDAHVGAALSVRWNSDGSGFLSCGEDGFVKMWSRNGMLRSVLAQFPTPVFCASWDITSSRVLYCSGENCFVKSLKLQTSPMKWKAHDGVILCCDWSSANSLIVTGAEDCKFKVWDSFGQILFNSSVHDYPITSICWNNDGNLFAVGSHNILRLCDKSGWSHSLEKMNSGSVLAMNWSPDGTQLAVGTASGFVFHAHIIEKRLSYEEFEIVQTHKTIIEVRDVSSEISKETLETKERISRVSFLYNHLLVVTSSNIYIYSSKNWNTPAIVDVNDKVINFIVQCKKIFLITDGSVITVYTYDGRKQVTLNSPGQATFHVLRATNIDLSDDTLVVQDRTDTDTIHFFDTLSGKSQGDGKLKHENAIVELKVNQNGTISDRQVAFRDSNGGVFLSMVKTFGASKKIAKIGSLIEQLAFNNSTSMLCGLSEDKLVIWTLPSISFFDRSLLQRSIVYINIGSVGKFPQLLNFVGNQVTIKKSDGCTVPIGLSPFFATLTSLVAESKWGQALRLCRSVNNNILWATFAGVSLLNNNLISMEIAYAALNDDEKISVIHEIKEKEDKKIRQAMQISITGKLSDADKQLELYGEPFKALLMNIQMQKWSRALELATKNDKWMDVLMGFREKYLNSCELKETDPAFLKHKSKVEVDWVHIRNVISSEQPDV